MVRAKAERRELAALILNCQKLLSINIPFAAICERREGAPHFH